MDFILRAYLSLSHHISHVLHQLIFKFYAEAKLRNI